MPKSEEISYLRMQKISISTNISRVAVKVPPFWKSNPRLWFNQLESQSFTAEITLDTIKYHTLVCSFESDTANALIYTARFAKSKIDLKAYLQIAVQAAETETGITTPIGLLVMPLFVMPHKHFNGLCMNP
ncbi:hypothetical protein GQX74_011719 [Glossina fuscipes]|nr:hypothetical protein GQX74_011719 [Glossina fuscipes]